MRIGGKIGIAGVVLGLVLSTTQTASANPDRGDRARSAGMAGQRSVTLITGDRVIVSDAQGARAVRPAPGRERMRFASYTLGGHLFVIPNDAARLVASGRLDRRLFDVTTLIEFGYDDASRPTLPLIVTRSDGQVARADLSVAGTTVTRDLPSVGGVAVLADKGGTSALWEAVTDAAGSARVAAAGVEKVWLDGVRRSTLDRSVPQIGAPAAWEAGFTGAGVKVAVLDTGVDQTHPDLADRELAEQNFSDSPSTVDNFGHGTHVASIVAGTGAKANGKYKGVAHGASVLDGKVLNDGGFGQESWIIAGMQWAAEQGAKVANLSLGGGDTPELDPLEEAVNTLSAQHGILFVIAAGNSGRPGTISSPGSADAALTVGAIDRDESIAFFSSRGPRVGDGAIKPDVTAPGVQIVAALHSAGTISPPVEPGYTALSGTSMATPHVAGSAALLAQQHPDWTGAQLKAVLSASAKPNSTLSVFDQGAGRVDVAKAITQTVTSEPTNVSLGVVAWPHDDDKPVTKQLGYRNAGAADVTLQLAVEATGPDGKPAPAGLFSLSANEITVPAAGEATISVTGTTTAATLDGLYSGTVVATGGSQSARTPIAINREVESYNLTINHRGPDGAALEEYSTLIVGLDSDTFAFPYDADGSVTARLPKGRYLLDSFIFPGEHFAYLVSPGVNLIADTTVELDARAAKPISVTPPDPAATLQLGDIGYSLSLPDRGFSAALLTTDLSGVSTAQIGPALPPDVFNARVNTQWTAVDGAFYGLAWFLAGTFPTGFTRVVGRAEVATVRAEFGSVTPDRGGWRFAFPSPRTGSGGGAWAVLVDVPLPGARTEFYNTEGLSWSTGLWQIKEEPGSLIIEADFESEQRIYRAGRSYTERFNHAMFGPAFPRTDIPQRWASRSGDVIGVGLPLFSDGAGNAGFSIVDSGSTVLFRNGQKIGETPFAGGGEFEVPAEPGDYRLIAEAVRPGIFDVGTAVSAAWTFRSSHVDEARVERLPLSAVRFFPRLDADNAAPAGTPYLVPVLLQRQPGDLLRPRRLSVDVSYDEGKTWRKAEVIFNLAVKLQHPADASSVSLRATATDRDGNTVEQTIIRAYKLVKR